MRFLLESRPCGATHMMRNLKTLLRFIKKRGLFGGNFSGLRSSHDSESTPRLHWGRTGLVLVTIAALSVLMSVHLTPDRLTLHEGDRAPREIRAARSVIYVNTVQTERLQQAATVGTRPVYETDADAADEARKTVSEIFERFTTERAAVPPKP